MFHVFPLIEQQKLPLIEDFPHRATRDDATLAQWWNADMGDMFMHAYNVGISTSRYGDGAESVGAAKRARLQRAAAMFLAQHPAYADAACRFDVVAIAGDGADARVHWLRNAFETD